LTGEIPEQFAARVAVKPIPPPPEREGDAMDAEFESFRTTVHEPGIPGVVETGGILDLTSAFMGIDSHPVALPKELIVEAESPLEVPEPSGFGVALAVAALGIAVFCLRCLNERSIRREGAKSMGIELGKIAAFAALLGSLCGVPYGGQASALPALPASFDVTLRSAPDPFGDCPCFLGGGGGSVLLLPATFGIPQPPFGGVPPQSVLATLSAFPNPTISDAGATDINGWVVSNASITYQFGIIAPPGIPTAPVQLVAFGNSLAFGDAGGEVEFEVSGPNVPPFTGGSASACGLLGFLAAGCGPSMDSFIFNQTFTLDTNTPYTVSILDLGDTCLSPQFTGINACGNGSYVNFIDPYVAIDPNFLALNPGVQLVLSPGIGNAPISVAVSEPSMLALVVAWLVATALFGYRGVCSRSNRCPDPG
jgi:hypothetical protein